MDYKESLEYLYRQLPMFSRVGAAAYKPGLDTSLALDAFFGNPHRSFRSIHVAGTNGKGSTSHMLAAMLQAQGYKTALYTSPHLVDFRERMRINGKMIPKEKVTDFVERFRSSGYEGRPSFFELTMMMAFDWFAAEKVDYAVIEVGMGGRLDSTNIIAPVACVITNISPDHMQFLGSTLPAIAREKAGIMKPGVPVVVGEAEGEIRRVFEERAAEVGAPVVFAQDEALLTSCLSDGNVLYCTSPLLGDFRCTLTGDYQRHNINTVLSALKMLRGVGIRISDEAARTGFAEVSSLTGLAGRWMKIADEPLTLCDTGHNEAGIRSNTAQLLRVAEEKGGEIRMVIGFVADKDLDHILGLLPGEAKFYLTNADIPRALPAADLARRFDALGLPYEGVWERVSEAFDAAEAASKAEDVLFIGGSTFVVADFLASRNPA